MSDPSAEDYPVTWGGVLLCCTYTSVIAFRFLLDALICPPLRALSVSWGFLVGLMRAYPAVFMAPLILLWKVLALARRRWRMLTWRHQALYISGILIYFACCVLRVGLWLVTWIGHWPWWFAPDTCVLYMATLLQITSTSHSSNFLRLIGTFLPRQTWCPSSSLLPRTSWQTWAQQPF